MRHTAAPWNVTGQAESARYIVVQAANGCAVARVPWNTAREIERGDPAADASDAALERIVRADASGNNGAVMGEAVLCRAFATQALAAIRKATQGGP